MTQHFLPTSAIARWRALRMWATKHAGGQARRAWEASDALRPEDGHCLHGLRQGVGTCLALRPVQKRSLL